MSFDITTYPHIHGARPNRNKIPKVKFNANDETMDEFNTIYHWLKETYPTKFRKVRYTKSGGLGANIKTDVGARWDVVCQGRPIKAIEIIAIIPEGCYIFRFGADNSDKVEVMSGTQAMYTMRDELAKDGINIDDYITPEEKREPIKGRIRKAHIKELCDHSLCGTEIQNVHHLDLNSAYASVLADNHPEMKVTLERIYNGRKEHPEYKGLLNSWIGAGQSRKSPFNLKWVNLAREAVNGTYDQIEFWVQVLKSLGYEPILSNTDGVWYADPMKHGPIDQYVNNCLKAEALRPLLGKKLGQAKTDYVFCKFRYRSVGAYEFYGRDARTYAHIYKPVVRGVTTYDMICPRDKWQWGDIFKGSLIQYKFDEERGIYHG